MRNLQLLHNLVGNIPLTLPHSIFFEPNKEFMTFLKDLVADRPVVEIGAGVGLLASLMKHTGIDITAIDCHERECPLFDVEMVNALGYPYEDDCLVIAARPDHGGWVSCVLDRLQGKADFLYIGLERNVDIDLDDHLPRAVKVFSGAGSDGENVWLIEKDK